MSEADDQVEQMREKLDHLEDEIKEAEADAEKVTPKKPEETFIDPGTEGRDQVDNSIAPPG